MLAGSPFCFLALLPLAAALFFVGRSLSARADRSAFVALLLLGGLLAAPAVLYAVHYLVSLDGLAWVYDLRALPGSELFASGAGFAAGVLQPRIVGVLSATARPAIASALLPALLATGLFVPYAKVVLRPRPPVGDKWKDGVCMQTTAATCGPCSAATLLRARGLAASEADLARDASSSGSSTEAWYLMRALRDRGIEVEVRMTVENPSELPVGAIAGTELRMPGGTGHFIAVLGRNGERYVVADSLAGRLVLTRAELAERYHFTGFFLRLL